MKQTEQVLFASSPAPAGRGVAVAVGVCWVAVGGAFGRAGGTSSSAVLRTNP